MNNVSTLKDTTRLILLAGLMCGIVGFVHAQAGAGGAAGGRDRQVLDAKLAAACREV